MANGRRSMRALRSTLANRPMTRWVVLALLAAMPVTVYAAAVTGLTTFVNGTIADADQMNANFAAVETAVDDNDARINTLEAIPNQQCASGSYATGIDASGNLLCGPPPASTTIVSTPIPSPWTGDTVTTPDCPAGTNPVRGGLGIDTSGGAGFCNVQSPSLPTGLLAVFSQFAGNAISCFAALQSGTSEINASNCECLAICQ